ncbi:deoxyribonuclease IV [bacterium]|nr:deoxyribonuclease IV [bacterium]
MIIGAHVSTAGGVFKAPANGAELGIEAIAIFAKNQRQWKAKPYSDEDLEKWYSEIELHGITYTCSHMSYLVNPCAVEDEKRQKSIDGITDEIERAEKLGLKNAVIHPGSHLNEGEEWGIKVIAESLDEVHKRLPGYKAKITLEITAGQGTNIGYKFEHLAEIIDRTTENERLAVCFDTCHAFGAGYALDSEEKYNDTWAEWDKLVGLDRIELFHINDSKKEFGSRRDRHEHIGEGLMGLEPFRFLMNDARFKDIPAILETPEGGDGYAKDIKVLKSLVR